MAKKSYALDSEIRDRIKNATSLKDLIVRRAPHHFPATDYAAEDLALNAVLQVLENNYPSEISIKELVQLSGISYKTVRKKLIMLDFTSRITSHVVSGVRFYRLKEITNARSESVSLSGDSPT